MLLTGFDSKYLNTLYVDKKLRYHGLIQSLSRTNRVLNDSKPNGHILDFRQQQQRVDEAIELFSGAFKEKAKEIWLAPPAAEVIDDLAAAVRKLDFFMQSQGLAYAPAEVPNLKGDAARSLFINLFKEVQRYKTKLEQYTDLTPENTATIAHLLPADTLQAFKGVYLDLAQRLKAQQDKGSDSPEVQQLEFEFVLFASAIIDYDYIMALLARYTQEQPGKQTMTREQVIGLIESEAKFMDEREDIVAYIDTLHVGQGLTEAEIRAGYETFKAAQNARPLAEIATRHGLDPSTLHRFVEIIMRRMIFDGERLTDLLAPLGLGWKARKQKEDDLMADLIPHLHKLAQGREISGLRAYEQ
jgi:type I restriction enzyme R subunit